MRKRIRELEQLGRTAQMRTPGAGRTGARPTSASDRRDRIAAVESEIARLETEQRTVESRIRDYENRIEVTPKREQEVLSVSRDYENTKALYMDLLKKKLEAEQAQTMEERQKGEQFLVIDPAQLPTAPWKPDVPKLMLLSIALGLGAGCGLALVLEYRDRSFRDAEDLQAFAEIPVLAVVPKIEVDGGGGGKRKASYAPSSVQTGT
jgi:uncharacterized protein involved in exopolysaccharide biosynthesis